MSTYKGYTQAQGKATQKYIKENMDRFNLQMKKGEKEKYQRFAQSKGLSMTAWIIGLMEKDMQND